jgi:hypothetical protein
MGLWLCGTRYNGFHVNETRARPSVHICWYPACRDKCKHRASIEDNVSEWSWVIFYWYFTLKNLFLATVNQEYSVLLDLMGRELFDSYN